jgi:uncharacterized FAD-dependent dehydrogenase
LFLQFKFFSYYIIYHMYRIFEIKLRAGEDESLLPGKIMKKLRARNGLGITEWRIARRSLDARDKRDIRYVYAVDFELAGDGDAIIARARSHGVKIESVNEEAYVIPRAGDNASNKLRPVIAGFGPCGIFAAYVMAKAGLRPIVIERGRSVDERTLDVAKYWKTGDLDESSNVLFGEGGAGAFSDGKLTTGIGDARKSFVLATLAGAGGDPNILIDAHPHIGTDVLRRVVKNLREEIISLGGEVQFSTRLVAFETNTAGILSKVTCENNEGLYELETDKLVLAIGHSARDTYEMLLANNIEIVQKPFSIGLRIEHRQSLIDTAMYGAANHGLPPAEYKLSTKCLDGRGVYTFCMCPGGEVIAAASEPNGVCANGMSNHARSGKYANSAVLADVRTDDFASSHPLAGMEFQRKWERAAFDIAKRQATESLLPMESLADFCGADSRLANCLPDFAVRDIREALPFFGKKIRGFDVPDARLYGPETRSSAPVRITRAKETMQSSISGIYPCGEGAGFAGGIMSAAVDGIKVAEVIISAFL